MRAIVLAGGLGRRLGQLTSRTQKCLFEIGDEAILTRTVRLVLSAGISEVTVVTGHCAPLVREELERRFVVDREEPPVRELVTIVHNPRYAATGTAYPLWLARFAFDEPMLLIDGNVVFAEAALTTLLRASRGLRAAGRGDVIAVSTALGADRPSVCVDAHGCVSRVRRDVARRDGSLRLAGLAILSRATLTDLFPALERRVITLDRASDPYEAAFEELLAGARLSLRALDLGKLACVPIERPEDLQRARFELEGDSASARTLQ